MLCTAKLKGKKSPRPFRLAMVLFCEHNKKKESPLARLEKLFFHLLTGTHLHAACLSGLLLLFFAFVAVESVVVIGRIVLIYAAHCLWLLFVFLCLVFNFKFAPPLFFLKKARLLNESAKQVTWYIKGLPIIKT